MYKINSNLTCIGEIEGDNRDELKSINKLFHHSNSKAIDNIVATKSIWFTPFEKQKTELKYGPNKRGTYFTACFGKRLFTKDECDKFKGDEKIDAVAEIDFENIFSLFNREKCCVMVCNDGHKYNIKFVGKQSKANSYAENDFINNIFARIFIQMPKYTQDKSNESNIMIDDINELIVSNHIGGKINAKFDYQGEIKMVLELLSTKEILIPEPELIECYFNPSVEMVKIDIE